MTDNRVKIPPIIALILEGLSFLISVTCVLNQDAVIDAMGYGIKTGQKIIPLSVYILGASFLIQLAFLAVTLCYKGDMRRLIAGIFTAAYCMVNISSYLLSLFVNRAMAIKGQEVLAANSVLTSSIANLTSGFLTVAVALFFIAVGRYGITKNPENENQYYPTV